MPTMIENAPLAAYLEPGPMINRDSPVVAAFVDQYLRDCDAVEAARRAFTFVRDEVAHSWDIQGHRVTRSADDVLSYREGICYPKSHLLAALLRRAHEMKMQFIYMKQPVKMPAYEEILRKAGLSDSAVAYIGDDLPDIPLMRRAGLAIAVGDAVPEVKEAAHYTTRALAGHGAIREAVELVLKSKGIWEAMIDKARA